MSRLTPNGDPEFPPDPPVRPPVQAFRVVKSFNCEGFEFREGDLVSPDSPLAQAIFAEHPKYLQPAR
jgi:hypothetical protein